jgi:metallo-beta-lactamase class B
MLKESALKNAMMRFGLLLLLSSVLPFTASTQNSKHPLIITHLTDAFYVYTTYGNYEGKMIPANGMYVVTNEGAVLFDTPWDTTLFQPLLDSIRIKHAKKVIMCLATHFHEDRTAGLEYYAQSGIKTYTTRRTDELSKNHNKKRARHLLYQDSTFSFGSHTFRVIYPGEGHSPDNIVVWFPAQRVLYGGCLVKSTHDESLGNLSDANVMAYAATIRRVIKACPDPQFVIPGHNAWDDAGSLDHTLKMAEALKSKRPNQDRVQQPRDRAGIRSNNAFNH